MKVYIEDVGEIVEYSHLVGLAPTEYPQVSVYNKVSEEYELKTIYRKYMSYGKTPDFADTGKSYMFNNKSEDMPVIIQFLLNWAKGVDSRYNNVYVNWYKDGQDFIEPHSDCTNSLVPDSSIMIFNLNEGRYIRTFKIENKLNPEDIMDIPLLNGRAIILFTDDQTNYRHWVGQENTDEGRISITFRAVK